MHHLGRQARCLIEKPLFPRRRKAPVGNRNIDKGPGDILYPPT
jgi:hypothetical protein